ncbi:MAG: hypothetical protein HY682_07820 [Chloroflexi bacterium]|nr:hypothetical protein [Chloroflexota bacterium]
MPRFIDHHTKMGTLPKEAVDMIRANVKAGKADQFGVKPIDVLLGDGESYCITDAPNADAVLRSHKALGFELGTSNVKQVRSLAAS